MPKLKILPALEQIAGSDGNDFKLKNGRGCFIVVDDKFSVFIYRTGDNISAEIYNAGEEAGGLIDSASTGY